jgi:hypothetical protein
MKHTMRYLWGTLDYGLLLRHSASSELTIYTDADWAGCPNTRRSTSGYTVPLVSWSSKRQSVVSGSSAEAEYPRLLRQLHQELHAPLIKSTLVYCDSVSAVYLSTNPI